MFSISKFYKTFNCICFKPIIRVYKCHPFATYIIYARVTGSRNTTIFFMYYFYTRIFLSISVANTGTIVRTSIVNKNNFNICIRLLKQIVYAAWQIILHIVYGHYNANFWSFIHTKLK